MPGVTEKDIFYSKLGLIAFIVVCTGLYTAKYGWGITWDMVEILLIIIGIGIILGYWSYCIKWGLTRVKNRQDFHLIVDKEGK
jgi:hypothetical protein